MQDSPSPRQVSSNIKPQVPSCIFAGVVVHGADGGVLECETQSNMAREHNILHRVGLQKRQEEVCPDGYLRL